MKISHEQLIPLEARLQRTRSLLSELVEKKKVFLAQSPPPCEVVPVDENGTGDLIFVAKINNMPPIEWSIRVGEILHHLRSILDQLIWQLMLANGKKPDVETAFLVFDSADKLASSKKMKHLDLESQKLVNELKPYPGGNDLLWKLHRLDITDKHHHLILGLGSALESVDVWPSLSCQFTSYFPGIAPPDIPAPIRPAERDFPMKDGSLLCRVAASKRSEPGATVPPKFNFEIVYGDGELLNDEPLFPSLQKFFDLTEDIVKRASLT